MGKKKGETPGVLAGRKAEPEVTAPWSKGAKKKRKVSKTVLSFPACPRCVHVRKCQV
jgi:hypothetical protein